MRIARLHRPFLPALALLLAVALASGCRRSAEAAGATTDNGSGGPSAAPAVAGSGSPRVRMRELDGRLEPVRPGEIPFFDDPRSFRIRIDRATTAISTASMTALLNRYTFAYPGAPLRGLAVDAHDGKLRQRGTLHKGVDVPFEMDGELSARADGRLRVHPAAIKVAGVPAKRLLNALGVELVKVIKVRADRGVAIEGDDLILDPNRLLPPPAVSGRVGAARLEGDRIVLEFVGGEARSLAPPRPGARNYMYFRGRLRFGKLTMRDTDLLIADADLSDPFRFYLAQYRRQLVAGYSTTSPDLGLVAVMPDANEADRPLTPRAAARTACQ